MFAQPYGFTADNSHLGIVLKTNTELETNRVRNTVKEVYDQVISDLKAADSLLPETNTMLPTKYAAEAALARVYFQMNDFANAFAYSDAVIKSNRFAFDDAPDYIWNRFSQQGTTEAIFSLVNEANSDTRFVTLRNTFDSSGYLKLTRNTYQAGTNPADVRRAWYEDTTINNERQYFIKKFKATQQQLPIIHLTEMILTRAESAAELNQIDIAREDLNLILARAYNGTQSYNGTDKNILIRRIREQRALEMVLESGDRLQQIKRIGAKGETSTSRGAQWNCVGMILQIPYTERNTDPDFVFNPTGTCQ
jgi:tetratricopeptide (TPR) repeat protein